MKFKPHSEKQDKVVFSEKKIIVLACGIQFGKTMAGAVRTKMSMHKYTDPTDAFIIAAPTYKILQQATLPAFLSLMKGCGEYSKGDAVFRMHNGGTCYFRTATDPDSVVGITNVRHIWGDEAGLYPLYFHENLQARASFKQCPIVYTTSPYSLNWIYTDYIRPYYKDPSKFDHLDLIQARSNENPYFPEGEYERKRLTMDPRRFNMIYGGEFNKIEGLVYDNFHEDEHICPAESLPNGCQVIAGVDWGFRDPAVILVIAVYPNGSFRLIAEHYKTQQTITDLIEVAKRMKATYGIQRFYADPSQPASILEFNRNGLSCIKADNDIRPGIDAVYDMFNSGNFKIFEGKAPNLVDELSIYHYKSDPDIHADKDLKEVMPVDQYNHACDALRYVLYATRRTSAQKRGTILPGSTKNDLRLHANDALLLKNLKPDYDW